MDWLAVTSNIWSHSGINQGVGVHNVVRFVRNGATVGQNRSASVQSTMTYSEGGGLLTVSANLTNAYSSNSTSIMSWTRDLEYFSDIHVLRVHDRCTVASNVRPVFQLHVPVAPVVQGDGSIQAGNLHIVPLQPVTINIVSMVSGEYTAGYRIELTTTAGCTFDVELQAQ